ncbi:uncharacterized protein AB675_9881 [Cyphellophora attinorum]|uniref:Uncharacterized protein n=1 Tax=Cyphellophora attinorum TaxID=1664694 RepID=A0A0N0NP22_9EURO|nr:uncharacterized protein AB675_9881 [Phialophora attinorum]KPI42251.1 hypothetical protein AB675_9881 [Phialophora attinorum]
MHAPPSHAHNQMPPQQSAGFFSPPPPNNMHHQGPPQQHRHSVAAYPTGSPGGPPTKTKLTGVVFGRALVEGERRAEEEPRREGKGRKKGREGEGKKKEGEGWLRRLNN